MNDKQTKNLTEKDMEVLYKLKKSAKTDNNFSNGEWSEV